MLAALARINKKKQISCATNWAMVVGIVYPFTPSTIATTKSQRIKAAMDVATPILN